MKSIISKVLITGTIITALTLNLQAGPTHPILSDTGKMSKMDKMKTDKKWDKKMDKKMPAKKMAKDTGKMSKMSKM
ncbi:MAG: hypothetical protein JWQ34_1019 [Mucilaginibacter sp.]|uniref:hypothetical protein n=1 Tax=Mucilaginibacter sp. TaxID=1882438 RepID=UPI0026340B51|nr:hypothetical protein [Mucilaginibacter sp.]MDB5002794.1 hypothetical protein [Mucilaginibacter sp.]